MKLRTRRDILIDGEEIVVRRSHEGRKTRVRATFVARFGLKGFKKRRKKRRNCFAEIFDSSLES